ncbi:LUD domain-containing protein [Candidatus Hecatella orcuttiae]|jgi:L-lactate dehydrogenase complex protein LldG|uniref:LUD domain-containing protein n=1 Tax=Candidatus Hecatella orcuttiae TaxID=1935119 RepID=UPI002867CE35|nr:LUD domain-containing protein [Candidatus Hecatella orcuttiae]
MDPQETFAKEYRARLMQAARDEKIKRALSRAIASFRKNVDTALSAFPHTVKLTREVRRIKEESVERMEELVEAAATSVRKAKGEAYLAKDGREAEKIIGELVGSGKLVVKSKSLTGEEIELRQYLERRGNQVYETDLGEFIVQQLDIKPMHILNPSIHVPREAVAEMLRKLTGEEVPPDIAEEVQVVRRLLRGKFFEAHVGISGANVVSADTGSLFILENEGNARLATGAPPKHIALVGMEKVVPTLQDAWKVAEVTWRYAGYAAPSYLNMITGPSKTGDIEKAITYGVHGPRELHVVFLDNGRLNFSRHPVLKEALYCLRCGNCLYECPVFSLTAGYFGDRYFGGIGAVWAAIVSGDIYGEEFYRAIPLSYTCLTCGRCKVRCPVEIDVPEMIVELRKLAVRRFLEKPPS